MIPDFTEQLSYELTYPEKMLCVSANSEGYIVYSPILDVFYSDLDFKISSDVAEALLTSYDNGLSLTINEYRFEICLSFAYMSDAELPWDITSKIQSAVCFVYDIIYDAYCSNQHLSVD